MSSSLLWKPWNEEPEGEVIGTTDAYHFQSMLAQRMRGHDGSLTYGPGEVVVKRNSGAHTWIEGMADAGNKAAEEVCEILDRHESITLWVER